MRSGEDRTKELKNELARARTHVDRGSRLKLIVEKCERLRPLDHLPLGGRQYKKYVQKLPKIKYILNDREFIQESKSFYGM